MTHFHAHDYLSAMARAFSFHTRAWYVYAFFNAMSSNIETETRWVCAWTLWEERRSPICKKRRRLSDARFKVALKLKFNG